MKMFCNQRHLEVLRQTISLNNLDDDFQSSNVSCSFDFKASLEECFDIK